MAGERLRWWWRRWIQGPPRRIQVDIIHDTEANVFIGRGVNLPGLVVEAPTLDELDAEVISSISELIEANYGAPGQALLWRLRTPPPYRVSWNMTPHADHTAPA